MTTLGESQKQNQTDTRILEKLLEAQRLGHLSGIRGQLGQLITTSPKYDIAVSTAGMGGLTKIVVDTLAQAEQAIQFLKTYQIGRAGFFALDKIRNTQ
jgi:structural maintenance of chromosome 4